MEPIRCAKEEMKPDGTKEGATEERTLDIHYFGTKVAKLILDLLFLHHCLVYFGLSVRCTFMCSEPLAYTGKKWGSDFITSVTIMVITST